VTREGGDGEFLPDLEAHLEVFRYLREVMPQLVDGRWPVEGRIVADGTKQWLAVVQILAILA